MIFTTMFKLLAALVIGYILYKKKIVTDPVNKSMSFVVLNVACPCLVAYSIMHMESGSWQQVVELIAIGFIIYIALIVISFPLAKLLHPKADEMGTYYCMFLFSNCLFMGIPVCSAFLGSEAIFYLSIINVPFNLLFFTYGRLVLAKGAGDRKTSFQPQNLVNTGLIAVFVGLIFYFLPIDLPKFITESLSFIGDLSVPLSMLLIGCTIASFNLKEILKEWKYYIASAIRLLVIPLILLVICKVIDYDSYLTSVIVLSFGMPVASLVSIGAVEYGGNIKVASSGVALSTILSLITIPLLAIILNVG